MNLEEWGRKLQQDKQIERFPDAKEMFAADPYEIHLFQRECNGWIIAENGWVIWDSIECGGGLSLRSFLAFLYTAEEQGEQRAALRVYGFLCRTSSGDTLSQIWRDRGKFPLRAWRRFPRPSPAMEGRGARYAFRCQRGKTVPVLRTGCF